MKTKPPPKYSKYFNPNLTLETRQCYTLNENFEVIPCSIDEARAWWRLGNASSIRYPRCSQFEITSNQTSVVTEFLGFTMVLLGIFRTRVTRGEYILEDVYTDTFIEALQVHDKWSKLSIN